MATRNPVPTRWLLTDERMGEALWCALRRMPPGSGVVVRHGATSPARRRRLIRRVRRIATARRLVLVVAGGAPGAGTHGPGLGRALRTWSAHDRREAIAGAWAGARLFFVSPVFPTRSHPGAPALGAMKAARIARGLGAAVALGGMDERRWISIRRLGFAGWAGIDAWTAKERAGEPRRTDARHRATDIMDQ